MATKLYLATFSFAVANVALTTSWWHRNPQASFLLSSFISICNGLFNATPLEYCSSLSGRVRCCGTSNCWKQVLFWLTYSWGRWSLHHTKHFICGIRSLHPTHTYFFIWLHHFLAALPRVVIVKNALWYFKMWLHVNFKVSLPKHSCFKLRESS